MIKLINIKDFELILNLIEEEIRNVEDLKEKITLDNVFYLDKIEKLDLKEVLESLTSLKEFFEKQHIEIKE